MMKIGLAYNLKESIPLQHNEPDDALEEYDSIETVDAISSVLERAGHSVLKLGGGREFLSTVLSQNVDLVFNIAEGLGNHIGREAQVPAVLEMLNIPYTGADSRCLMLCLDKPLTKRVLATTGITTPRWQVITHGNDLDAIDWAIFPFPAFIKPAHEGSSKGIRPNSLVDNIAELRETVLQMLEQYKQPVMVEEYISGDEITVGLLGNKPPQILGIMRVIPRIYTPRFIYSLEMKREWEYRLEYECPAQLDSHILNDIADQSIKIYNVVGCRDFARMDFRIGKNGTPYFLEINPLAGLNPKSSDLSIMARKVGRPYEDIILTILNSAMERYPQCLYK